LAIFSSSGAFTGARARLVCAEKRCCAVSTLEGQPFTAQNASVEG
jgi:hypothetical protein